MSKASETRFIGKRSSAAGGWGALKSCGKQLLASGAPLTGARALLKANQPDGFDCPGCAGVIRNMVRLSSFAKMA